MTILNSFVFERMSEVHNASLVNDVVESTGRLFLVNEKSEHTVTAVLNSFVNDITWVQLVLGSNPVYTNFGTLPKSGQRHIG